MLREAVHGEEKVRAWPRGGGLRDFDLQITAPSAVDVDFNLRAQVAVVSLRFVAAIKVVRGATRWRVFEAPRHRDLVAQRRGKSMRAGREGVQGKPLVRVGHA